MALEVLRIGREEKVCVTSLEVAEAFEKQHKHVLEDVRAIGGTISTAEFSALFLERTYTASNGKENPMYVMTRDGFTLLAMGYTGEKAMRFKMEYIKQFNAMEKLLTEKIIEREKGIVVRLALTKALKESAEDARMHGHAYSNYTNCIYKALFGMNTKELREFLQIDKKANIRDHLTKEQLAQVQTMENLTSSLLECGWDYQRIKEFIQENNVKRLT